jgi:hypothetical protein
MTVRKVLTVTIVVLAAGLGTSAGAQEKIDCLDRIGKLTTGSLGGLLSESKPSGRCPLAQWGVRRHNEILKMYNAEPDECKKTDLGKSLGKTLRSLISQHARDVRRYCRRG